MAPPLELLLPWSTWKPGPGDRFEKGVPPLREAKLRDFEDSGLQKPSVRKIHHPWRPGRESLMPMSQGRKEKRDWS